jgi:hypothetical protein
MSRPTLAPAPDCAYMVKGDEMRDPHMFRPTTSRTRLGLLGSAALLATLLIGAGTATPARAQFSWFGPSEASPQDVYDTIAEHGFRLVGPLYRNGRVYVADVIDRRQRRERLVLSVDSGQIVQRYFVDVGASDRRQALAERPRPQPRDDDSFFSRLSRGWDDEPPPRPPAALPGPGDGDLAQPTVVLPRTRPRTEPRVVTRTDVAPVTAAPLAPVPGPMPDKKTDAAKKLDAAPAASTPAQAPAAAVPPAPSGSPPRATTVVSDPLRIPGSTKRAEDTKPAAAPAAVATAKPPEPPVAKPAPAKPADVPVAPLD